MHDVFRPHTEPAATIYDAFQAEARKRVGRPLHEWILMERKAVHETAVKCAEKHGFKAPSMDEIEKEERAAYGSADYGSKWAIKVANLMNDGKGTF